MCKIDDRLPHQKIKFFIASKRVGSTLTSFNFDPFNFDFGPLL